MVHVWSMGGHPCRRANRFQSTIAQRWTSCEAWNIKWVVNIRRAINRFGEPIQIIFHDRNRHRCPSMNHQPIKLSTTGCPRSRFPSPTKIPSVSKKKNQKAVRTRRRSIQSIWKIRSVPPPPPPPHIFLPSHQNFLKAYILPPIQVKCSPPVSSYWMHRISPPINRPRPPHGPQRKAHRRKSVAVSTNAPTRIVVKIISNPVIWRPINVYTPARSHSYANGKIVIAVFHGPMNYLVTSEHIPVKRNLCAPFVRSLSCAATIFPNMLNVMQRKIMPIVCGPLCRHRRKRN